MRLACIRPTDPSRAAAALVAWAPIPALAQSSPLLTCATALLANLVLTMEAFLLTRNLLTLLMCAPIHGVCALLCARDARFFDLVLLWGRTRLPAHLATLRLWRASSYSPLTLDLPRGDGCRRSAPVVPIAPHGRRAAPC